MSESLRDQLSANFDKVTNATIPGEGADTSAPAEIPGPKTDAAPSSSAAEPQKGGQARDEKGRFAESAKAPADAGRVAAGAAPAAQVTAPAAAEPAKPRPQRPSTWKKDYWEAFDKLATENPALAEYINQREGEYANGVSTYKREWDRAKPLLDAMAPFLPLLEQHRIEPHTWISRLGQAHQVLALGNPQQKLTAFTRLAQDYGVPLQALFTQDAEGKWYLNPNQQALASAAAAAQPQAVAPEQIEQQVLQKVQAHLEQERTLGEIQAFAAQKEKYPHFEAVRDTMAGLLQAGLAEGLEDAYRAALAHPRHADLAAAIQEQERAAKAAAEAEERKRAAEAARRKAVSPRTSTPTSVAAAAEGKKDRRSVIEEAFDARMSGRV